MCTQAGKQAALVCQAPGEGGKAPIPIQGGLTLCSPSCMKIKIKVKHEKKTTSRISLTHIYETYLILSSLPHV